MDVNIMNEIAKLAETVYWGWDLDIDFLSPRVVIVGVTILGLILLLISLAVCFFGHKIDKFLIGFYMFSVCSDVVFGILKSILYEIKNETSYVVVCIIGMILCTIITIIAGVISYKFAKKSEKFYKVGMFLVNWHNITLAFIGIVCCYTKINNNILMTAFFAWIVGLVMAIVSLKYNKEITILSTAALYGICAGIVLTFLMRNALFGKVVIPLLIIAGFVVQMKLNGAVFKNVAFAHDGKQFTLPKVNLVDDINSAPKERFCNQCGQKITDPNVKFCIHCGAKL